jgi:hypothetical protein
MAVIPFGPCWSFCCDLRNHGNNANTNAVAMITIKAAANNQYRFTGLYPSLNFDIAANCQFPGNGITIMRMVLIEKSRGNQRLDQEEQGTIHSVIVWDPVIESYHETPEKVLANRNRRRG